MPLKIAVSGKGGVGKTTVVALLADQFAKEGRKVIAVDADPAANLMGAMGVPMELQSKVVPLSSMLDLIEERTGSRPGSASGGVYKLNPKVDDLADKYGVVGSDGVKVLVLGTIKSGGSGCFCPESALLKNLMSHLILEKEHVVIMDMEAGLEHLGRASSKAVDVMLIVLEPGRRSLETGANIARMARENGIRRTVAVLNKISTNEEEREATKIASALGLEVVATIPLNHALVHADLEGVSPLAMPDNDDVVEAVQKLRSRLLKSASSPK
jgi:CO dehydrogenase maturation factor